MALLTRRYDKPHLKINELKSAIASAFRRKLLGYSLRESPKGENQARGVGEGEATFKRAIALNSYLRGISQMPPGYSLPCK